jgi:hypothetical protein
LGSWIVRIPKSVLGSCNCCSCSSMTCSKEWQGQGLDLTGNPRALEFCTRDVGASQCSSTQCCTRGIQEDSWCRHQWWNQEAMWQCPIFCNLGQVVLWYAACPIIEKTLRSWRWWLVNARVLAAKSHQRIFIGQMPLTA